MQHNLHKGIRMKTTNQSAVRRDKVAPKPFWIRDEEKWARGIKGEWLKAGLHWSAELTTLECAFLEPRRLFRALDQGKIRNKKVELQVAHIAARLVHLRVTRNVVRRGGTRSADSQFMLEWDEEGDITDVKVMKESDDAGVDGAWVCDHLDLTTAAYLTEKSARVFSEKACWILFGSARPTLDQMSNFIRDLRNFDPWCHKPHAKDCILEMLGLAESIMHVPEDEGDFCV
jgi:hypothetical protein